MTVTRKVIDWIGHLLNRSGILLQAHSPKAVAILLTFIVVLWIATGRFEYRPSEEAIGAEIASSGQTEEQVAQVRYVDTVAQEHEKVIELSGITQPEAIVTIYSEVSGLLVDVTAEPGTFVTRGTNLARVDVRELEARRNEVAARVKQLNLELKSAISLSGKGYQSELQLVQKEAQLASAQAALDLLQLDEERSHISTPIEGYYQNRLVEIGSLLSPGKPVAIIADLNPLRIEVSLSEFEVREISNDTRVETFIDGVRYPAEIVRISALAREKTRVFPVEVKIDNPERLLKAGYSAKVLFYPSNEMSHEIKPSWLVLNDEGETGLKTFDADGRVVFKAIEVIGNDEDKLWITGLNETERIITLGFEHATDGSQPTRQLDNRYAGR